MLLLLLLSKLGHGVNDQWEPRSSSDNSKPYHYWWLKKGTAETLAYDFDQPYTVSSVQVYWLDFDHYDGDYRAGKLETLLQGRQ